MTILLSWEGVKEIDVTKSNVFKEFVMTLLASTRVFDKKSKLVFDFCHFLRFFVEVRYILDICRSQGLPKSQGNNKGNYFVISFRNYWLSYHWK